ncbi:MAG: HPF/RaiA family ribosome-associated protein [Polyangiaceae bacterium]
MQIQVSTDSNIEGSEKFTSHVEAVVNGAVGRFSDHITRVEVHVTDEVAHKSGQNDKRCVMEARLEGRQPTAVTHEAGTVDQALEGAANKLEKVIESTLGRLRDHQS